MVEKKKAKKPARFKRVTRHCGWCGDLTLVLPANPDPMCAECKVSHDNTCEECGDIGLAAGRVHECRPPNEGQW